MNYTTILAGLTERFQTVPGLAAVLDYEPQTVGSSPLLYSLFDSWEPTEANQRTKQTYRLLHRVCVAWQDNQGAEALLLPFLSSVPAAIRADRSLGGRLTTGYSTITGCVGAFVIIGGVLCRAYDFTSESFYKD